MKAVVVYESMYGNTHLIANAIGDGLGRDADVTVVSIEDAAPNLVEAADLLVVGGPTHAHRMNLAATVAPALQSRSSKWGSPARVTAGRRS